MHRFRVPWSLLKSNILWVPGPLRGMCLSALLSRIPRKIHSVCTRVFEPSGFGLGGQNSRAKGRCFEPKSFIGHGAGWSQFQSPGLDTFSGVSQPVLVGRDYGCFFWHQLVNLASYQPHSVYLDPQITASAAGTYLIGRLGRLGGG